MASLANKKIDYALLILVDLAMRRTPGLSSAASSRDIAATQRLSPKLVPQLVAALSAAGFVATARGPYGGAWLAEEPDRISVWDVVQAVEGPASVKPCLAVEARYQKSRPRHRSCHLQERGCPLRDTWWRAQAAVERVLSRTTIADLVEAKRKLIPGYAAAARRRAGRGS